MHVCFVIFCYVKCNHRTLYTCMFLALLFSVMLNVITGRYNTCMFLALLFSVMLNVITGRYIYMYVFGFVIFCYVKCNHRTLYTCMFLALLFSAMLNVITGCYIHVCFWLCYFLLC